MLQKGLHVLHMQLVICLRLETTSLSDSAILEMGTHCVGGGLAYNVFTIEKTKSALPI